MKRNLKLYRYTRKYYVFRYEISPRDSEAEQMHSGTKDECINFIKRELELPKGIYSVEYYDYMLDRYEITNLYRVNR